LTNDLNISPSQINGGVEFNGWNRTGAPDPRGWYNENFWKDNKDKYRLASAELCGFETIKIYPSKTIYPPSTDSVFVLKNLSLNRRDTILCGAETLNIDSTAFLSNKASYTFGNIEARNSEKVYSGDFSIKLKNEKSFGFSIQLDHVKPCERIKVSLMRNPALSTAAIVASSNVDLNNFYKVESNNILFTDENGWGKLIGEFVIPENFKEKSISIYLYHPADYPTWIDNLEIVRMSRK